MDRVHPRTIVRSIMRMPVVEFGSILKDRRESKGLTQEQLASRADLSARFIQSLEATDKLPSLETVFKISHALNTSPGVLLEALWAEWKANRRMLERISKVGLKGI